MSTNIIVARVTSNRGYNVMHHFATDAKSLLWVLVVDVIVIMFSPSLLCCISIKCKGSKH